MRGEGNKRGEGNERGDEKMGILHKYLCLRSVFSFL